MNIWSGTITLNGEQGLKDISLVDATSTSHIDISEDCAFSLRCFVNPSLIPLWARAGSSLELHTTNHETSQWLKDSLLCSEWPDSEDLEKFQSLQCPVGMLISVNKPTRGISGFLISDFLVYGVLSSPSGLDRPPTPPVSFSTAFEKQISLGAPQELKLFAAPLSAGLIEKAQGIPSPPPSPADTNIQTEHYAEFLPDLRSSSPKRKRMATLFEVAAQHHKRVRQRGGEAVSQLMAPTVFQSSQQLSLLKIKRESEEPSLPVLEKIAFHRSRSLSLGTNLNPNKIPDHQVDNNRPSSARSHVRNIMAKKLASTVALEKEASPALTATFEETGEPSSTPKDAESIISENKSLITRTILTCMRLYGFNRTNTRSSTIKNTLYTAVNLNGEPCHDGETETRILANDSAVMIPPAVTDEDEFKAMYHATYRAATFALRKYLKESANGVSSAQLPPVLKKERATSMVDEFLRLFCEED
ncbi:hypothetical protein ASPZODRAFT_102577 [Penicilliopsis zonata CBS 506.65]|uniref:Sld7 C-terminal domain-containing protein n=1 Tax=Penicilliopsis zonata CBS 506.65 TaxID=1073090 RepID=A0A1L9S9F7_9EURO|nr:hypothetical protein ASPZODRAFT_102577 [Penicilliopsis zonata CBS 506.65]OJJ43796.1 hypothetical protein ASPZODRAFT_102577 [Penicilliopsis zonata CBS 506.65]